MLSFENNPLQEVKEAIEAVTDIKATVVFLAEDAGIEEAAVGGESNEEIYICLNVGATFDKMLQGMAMVAAGYASEKTGKTQEEIFSEITKELLKREAAENE